MKTAITARLILFAFVFWIFLPAGYYSQSLSRKDISLSCSNRPLRSVLDDIRIQSGINFIYDDNLVDDKKVTCQIENSDVRSAVKKVLSGLYISYKKFGEKVFVLYKEKKPVKTSYQAIVVDQNTSVSNKVVSFIKPEIISGNHPVYPAEAAKHNIEGRVRLKFLISNEGNVNKVVITETSGSQILDSAAIDYINNLKFSPAIENGVSRNIWMSIVLRYLVVGR